MSTAIATSAAIEKRRAARTARGRASAPDSRLAALQECRRNEAAEPDTDRQQMGGVASHGDDGAGYDGGSVTRGSDEAERQRGQHERFAVGRHPAAPLREVRADREERAEHEQETVAGQADEPGARTAER